MDREHEIASGNVDELLIFIKEAREGKLADIEQSSLSYLRYNILFETMEEEQYYYSIR
ncbi:hypothetical protein Mtc_0335 [Methanocella conradii HZ254]|jgi:hypothetical protein|uniref:Uncharacterized protein n=1 Tax=Methanocella conradii (strain DSM 24694 / JCM 17849 / CGMCC 1.5162 / HZ254) TaxID=1041930 RepID=H8IA40_METCZ|nr:hypothetical protein [Methanocella conradii]AFC99106.1 hypothetical protein Mtc_0335 [Methanocella conradii HZ254]MDI6896649.1 hypothetical protein [Methanocella conradii]